MRRFLISLFMGSLFFVSCGTSSNSADKHDDDSSIDVDVTDVDVSDVDVIPPADISEAGTTSTTYSSTPVSNEARNGVGEVFTESAKIEPSLESYTLPIVDRAEILNLQRDIIEKAGISFSEPAMEKLLNNGFVVLQGDQKRFTPYYTALAEQEIPVFVSSDSVMHLFHLYFDQILKVIEIKYLIYDAQLMIGAMVEESKRHYNSFEDPEMKNAALMELSYLSVIMKTLNPKYQLVKEVEKRVSDELALMEKHADMTKSLVFSYDCPFSDDAVCTMKPSDILALGRDKACYCEDFTQYVPRGHYDQTEELQRYFKAMSYMGRLSFLMKNNRSTIAAMLLVENLKTVKLPDERMAIEIWERIYRVTSFFVGASDDLLPSEYDAAFKDVFGEKSHLNALLDDKKMEKFVAKIESLRNPGILGSVHNGLLDKNEETKGLRLMGQRFAPDSFVLGESVGDNAGIDPNHSKKSEIFKYAHNNITLENGNTLCPDLTGVDPLTFDNSEMYCACAASVRLYKENEKDTSYLDFCRLMPSGLDVMTVLGSEQSKKIQKARDYKFALLEGTHNRLIDDFSKYTLQNWSQNIYWGWLYMLNPMLETHGAGWPVFMQTEAWQAFTLNSALTSWSQLRHDTILYMKQTYTEGTDLVSDGDPLPPKYYAYMEPTPQFLDRAYQLMEMTQKGLIALGIDDGKLKYSLSRGSKLVKWLYDISVKELENKPLDADEYDRLMDIGSTFERIIQSLASVVEVDANECESGHCAVTSTLAGDGNDDPFDARIVADVHTDPNTESVLETATGAVDYIIVVRKMENGTLGAAIGPVFSYREFTHPMSDRLTDKKWREMVETDKTKGVPEWVSSFRE